MTIDKIKSEYLQLIISNSMDDRRVAKLRLMLIDLVGEERQREFIGEWNEEARILKQADQEGAQRHNPLTVYEIKSRYLTIVVSKSLNYRSIARLRLTLIDLVGKEMQQELIGEWNQEAQQLLEINMDLALQMIAEDSISWSFHSNGMPLERVVHHRALWPYMRPDEQLRTPDELRAERQRRLAEGDFVSAYNAANREIAHAVLSGDSERIAELACEVLTLLEQSSLIQMPGEDDVESQDLTEQHEWLRDNATELADWGRQVRNELTGLVH